MKASSLTPRDRILWILSDSGGTLDRSTLRRRAGLRYVLLGTLLNELVDKGKVRMDGDRVSLL
jgi:predicted transcriptional regulator